VTVDGSDRAGECMHKLEAWYVNDTGVESEHSWMYFYVDDTSPVTTKEYGEPFCEYKHPLTYPIDDENFTVDPPVGWTISPSGAWTATGGSHLADGSFSMSSGAAPTGWIYAYTPQMTGLTGTYTLTFWMRTQFATATDWIRIYTDTDTAAGGETLIGTYTSTAPVTWDMQTVSIPATGAPFYIVFVASSGATGWLQFDDVNVTYDDEITDHAITSDTPIYLNCTDGEWNIEEESCPVGVNGTWINITNLDNGNYTGWTFFSGSQTTITMATFPGNHSWAVFDDCLHNISYYQVDWLGNTEEEQWQYFYLDNTPPDINDVTVIADYTEEWGQGYVAKNVTGGCFNITADITPTGCSPNETMVVQLSVDVLNSSALDGFDTVIVNMTQAADGTYYFVWCNDTVTDIHGKEHKNNTAENGVYHFEVIAKDCLGNENVSEGIFLVKPLIDVDIIEMTFPDPNIWHPEMPTSVKAVIKNNGILPAEGPINTHLQIYKEIPPHLEVYKFWDIESCIVSGMWETVDGNGDGATWYWTEKRANSPTHSWHSQPDNLPSYEAYSNDSLILSNNSNGIYIPELYYDDEYLMNKTVVFAYLTFSHWCRGEFSGSFPVDYGYVYIRDWNETALDWNAWVKIAGPYYENGTDDGVFDDVKLDISGYVGKIVQFKWTWFADATNNYEGWYIDDVNIDLSGSMQPLVYQEYKYVDTLAQNESKTIEFPLNFVPEPDTWYFFEIYSDYAGDVDGPADQNGVNRTDGRTGYFYWDPYNGVNNSLYFGDVCDAAVTAITVPDDVIMDHEVGYVEIPINVTVYNNGTLTKDIPVTVSAQHKLTNIIAEDDVENGALSEWGTPGMWVAGEALYEDVWTITDKDYFSPTHSWYTTPRTEGIGQAKLWQAIDPDVPGGLKWTANIKWNLPTGASAVPVFLASTYYWDLGE